MALSGVLQTGMTGLTAAKSAVSTAGHNIANANTEGYSRQKIETEASIPLKDLGAGKGYIGSGTKVSRIERVNDQYLEKQIRDSNRDLSHLEEKDIALKQVEDIFNEMNGDGLNRLVARFFNEFRKLANEPESEAIRQSVREASQALVNDFHRLRNEVEQVRHNLDTRIEGYTLEINAAAEELRDLNRQISQMEITGGSANDLQDKRDRALKKLATYMDLSAHKDNHGNIIVDVRGVGPLVNGATSTEKFTVNRSAEDKQGKPEGALDLRSSASANGIITHQLKGGKLGALLDVRDQALSTVLDRLDTLAVNLTQVVNDVHTQGVTRDGLQGVAFFKPLDLRHRAAEFIELSDEVKTSIGNIAAAVSPDSPGDNRIANAIAGLQDLKFMSDGKASLDDFYNSIMTDVGVISARTRSGINQQRDILTQLNKMRDQISGVSIDEETANLMQFQHAYDASAKVIQIADEMLKTVLDLKR